MNANFADFDKLVDLEGLCADIEAASQNSGDRVEVPVGEYECRIEKMEMSFSKNGDPMFVCWMRVLAGDYQNQMAFWNQVVTKPFQIRIVKDWLKAMNTSLDIGFESYSQFAQLVENVWQEINGNKEFAIVISEKNGFKNYMISNVFAVH